jgi:hypothetical protein
VAEAAKLVVRPALGAVVAALRPAAASEELAYDVTPRRDA